MNTVKPIQFVSQENITKVLSVKAHHSSEFHLLLSLYHVDAVEQVRIRELEKPELFESDESEHHYRHSKLKATDEDYSVAHLFHNAVARSSNANLLLLNAAFPQPLSQFNDGLRIHSEVINNSPIHSQQRYRNSLSSDIENQAENRFLREDQTEIEAQPHMLYDILMQLQS